MASQQSPQASHDPNNPPTSHQLAQGIFQCEDQDACLARVSLVTVGATPSQESSSRGQVVHFVHLASSILPPINRLPTEIKAMIFRMAVRTMPILSGSLLLVCRDWHYIVMSDAILWSVIYIDVDDARDESRLSKQSEYAYTSLARSRNSLLDITINLSAFDGDLSENTTSTFEGLGDQMEAALSPLDILAGGNRFTHRWRALRIILPQQESEITMELAASITWRFETIRTLNLEEFIFERGVVPLGHLLTTSDKWLTFGPKLKFLSVMYMDLELMGLVPGSLEHLHLGIHHEWRSFLALLKQSSLEFLSLRAYGDTVYYQDTAVDRPNPTTFNRLDHLSIYGCFSGELYRLLNLPSLRTLDIHGECALDILLHNNTFFPSVQRITWDPICDLEYILDNKPGLVEMLRWLGDDHFRSLREMLLPLCCISYVFPSLSTAAQEIISTTGTSDQIMLILIDNGGARIAPE